MNETVSNEKHDTGANERHNNYFTKIFTDILMLIELIKSFFPKDLSDIIDYSTIELCPTEFTDEELKKRYADVMIKLKIEGEDAYIHIMFEHKSTDDEGGIDQLRGYNCAQWDKDKKDGKKKRTPIINVLFYHGDGAWKYGHNFSDLYDVKSPTLKKYLMSLPIILIDLNGVSQANINGSIDLATAILLLANIRKNSKYIGKALDKLWSKYSKSEVANIRFMKSHVTYILNTRKSETVEDVTRNIKKPHTGVKVMTLVDEIKKEGIREGISKGISKGRKEREVEIARILKQNNTSYDLIITSTGLTYDEIEKL